MVKDNYGPVIASGRRPCGTGAAGPPYRWRILGAGTRAGWSRPYEERGAGTSDHLRTLTTATVLPHALDCALTGLRPGRPGTVHVRVALGAACSTVVSRLGHWTPRSRARHRQHAARPHGGLFPARRFVPDTPVPEAVDQVQCPLPTVLRPAAVLAWLTGERLADTRGDAGGADDDAEEGSLEVFRACSLTGEACWTPLAPRPGPSPSPVPWRVTPPPRPPVRPDGAGGRHG